MQGGRLQGHRRIHSCVVAALHAAARADVAHPLPLPCRLHLQGAIGGSADSIRLALRGRRHERLMKAAYVLAAPANCERVALHEQGNYSVQASSKHLLA